MAKPSFVVPAADLDRGPKSVSWPIPAAWLRAALDGTGARPAGEDGVLEAELSKNGREILVRGRARVAVEMDCVVTTDPVRIELDPEILLLLAPPDGGGHGGRESRRGGGRREQKGSRGAERTSKATSGKPATLAETGRRERNGGRHAEPGWSDDPELSVEDAGRDRFDGERVVLDDFLREFLLLELPAYPRRSDLPSDQTAAIAPPTARSADAPAVDPRLMPLAAIASRLREGKKE